MDGFKKDHETKDDTVADTSSDQSNTEATLIDQKKPIKLNGVANGNNNRVKNGNALQGKGLYDFLGAKCVDDQRSAFHKDFKIKGFIGEVGQRDKMSYISLKEKRYSDRETVTNNNPRTAIEKSLRNY